MTFHPAPPRTQTITITGKLMHASGPLGTNRPVRRSATIYFIARDLPFTMPGQQFALGATVTDGDGNFTLLGEASGIPPNVATVEDFIEVQNIPGEERQQIVLDGLRWGTPSTQDVGTFRLKWRPPEKALAEVNGRWLEDTRRFANQLAEALMRAQPKPYSALSTKIILLREAAEKEDYTRAQTLFRNLVQLEIHQDFPVRLVKEVNNIPMLRSNLKTTNDALLHYLHKISVFEVNQFERGTMLEMLIKAIGRSLGWRIDEAVSDPIPDAAAACALIYIAGRMAKDKGKMSSLVYGERRVEWSVGYNVKTVEISVGP